MSGYVRTFRVKDGDINNNNKLMSFCLKDEKLLEKYKAIWTEIEDLNIELNTLPVYDDRYIKIKVRTYDDKVYKKLSWLICAKRWYRMRIFYSYFYWIFACMWK